MHIRRSIAVMTAALLTVVVACGGSGSDSADDGLKGGVVVGQPLPGSQTGGLGRTSVVPVAGGTPATGLATMCTQGVASGASTAQLPTSGTLPGTKRPSAQISVGDLAIDESAGVIKVPVTLSGNNPFQQEFHVQFGWKTVDETAVAASDFTGVPNGVIDFQLIGTAAKAATFNLVQEVQVKVANDSTPEVDSMWRMGTETFGISVAPCKGAIVQLKKPKGTVAVTDDDSVFDLLGQGGNKREAIDSYLLSVAAMEAYAPDSSTGLSMPAYRGSYLNDLYAKRRANVIYAASSLTSDDVFVFSTNKVVVVAFRGTQQLLDAATDLMISFTPTGYSFSGNGLEFAHNGFWAAVSNLYPPLLAAVKAEVAKGKKVYVTGHSLGGAMSSAFAFRAAKDGVPIEFVSTFGSPRVFNGNAARDYSTMGLSARTGRWVFDDDIVTQIPSTAALTLLCAVGTYVGYISYVGTSCLSALASVFDEPFWHVGQVRHVAVSDENRNCSSISLQSLPEVLPNTAAEDYEPDGIGTSDHSMARYVNATYRFVGSSVVPPAPVNAPPVADDARFTCAEVD